MIEQGKVTLAVAERALEIACACAAINPEADQWPVAIADELSRLRARLAQAEAENAELRKLCGRAAKWVQVPRVSMEDAGEFEQCLSDLEAAAGRKP